MAAAAVRRVHERADKLGRFHLRRAVQRAAADDVIVLNRHDRMAIRALAAPARVDQHLQLCRRREGVDAVVGPLAHDAHQDRCLGGIVTAFEANAPLEDKASGTITIKMNGVKWVVS